MSDAIRARVVIVEAGAPIRRDTVVEFTHGKVVRLRDATAADCGPEYDVLLPGLIDAHSHGRGLPVSAHGFGGGPLERFLIELRAMTPLAAEDEALVAADAAIRTGITAMQVFHHSFGGRDEYAAQARAIADGCSTVGVRAFIALGLTDQHEYAPADGAAHAGVPVPSRGVSPEGFVGLASELLGTRGLARIDAVGPVAPQWCSDGALGAISAVSGAARIHAHLLESARQRLIMDGDPIASLARTGLLRADSSFAHGVWLDDDQIERLARAGAVIVHCPGSNARLQVGRCPVRRLLDCGVTVALGLDSHGAVDKPDMFAEMRLALSVAADAGAPLGAAEVLAMATTGGAQALCRGDLGTLRPGASADAVALELPSALLGKDPADEVVRHAEPGNIVGTWVEGQQVQPVTAVADARARSNAALARDTEARTARIASARTAWHAVDTAWRELASRDAVEARCR